LEAVLAEFRRASDGSVHVRIDGLEFAPANAEEILIIREIFVDGVYNCLPIRPTVVWDIGGNVGMASLFFSRLPCVEHVHAFEPLTNNRRQAEHHYTLNPGSAARITQHPHAVGREAGSMEATYAPTQRGSFSISRHPAAIERIQGGRLEKLLHDTITLVHAVQVLDQLAAAHPQKELLVKMDCEGAENDILPALLDTSRRRSAGRIQILLIETHHGYGTGLAKLPHDSGFGVLLRQPRSHDLGYLFAFNRTRSEPTLARSRSSSVSASAANLNIHLHCLVLDGVYLNRDGVPVFRPGAACQCARF
jgi:FkbM family methyltransferase